MKLMRANLVHLGLSFWETRYDRLQTETAAWDEIVGRMASRRFNMIVIDLGEGVRYKSHPEIACQGAWSTERLQEELARLRRLGIEPIPKLNFSATHDAWLGPYEKMLSTPTYYKVCSELIAEVAELFGRPRYLHIGMDEEDIRCQQVEGYGMTNLRQGDQLWHDHLWYIAEVEKCGARAMTWEDHIWEKPDYLQRMPKSAVQGWSAHYDEGAGNRAFRTSRLDREEALIREGYDLFGTPSNYVTPHNTREVVDYLMKRVPRSQLLGFCQSSWRKTTQSNRVFNLAAIDMLADIMDAYHV